MTLSDWMISRYFGPMGRRGTTDIVSGPRELAAEITAEWSVKARSKDKTFAQLAFFHGALLDAFVDSFGDTDKAYIKYVLKGMHLTRVTDCGHEYTASLADLNTLEMSRFIDQCLNTLTDMGGRLSNDGAVELDAVRNAAGRMSR